MHEEFFERAKAGAKSDFYAETSEAEREFFPKNEETTAVEEEGRKQINSDLWEEKIESKKKIANTRRRAEDG